MMLRLKELRKMGSKTEKYSTQVTWLTDLIGNLQRLVEVADMDENLAVEVFSKDVFSTIMNLFSAKEHLKMSKAADTYGRRSKERMEDILRRLDEMRSDANIMDKERVQKEKDKGYGTRGHLTNQPR